MKLSINHRQCGDYFRSHKNLVEVDYFPSLEQICYWLTNHHNGNVSVCLYAIRHDRSICYTCTIFRLLSNSQPARNLFEILTAKGQLFVSINATLRPSNVNPP